MGFSAKTITATISGTTPCINCMSTGERSDNAAGTLYCRGKFDSGADFNQTITLKEYQKDDASDPVAATMGFGAFDVPCTFWGTISATLNTWGPPPGQPCGAFCGVTNTVTSTKGDWLVRVDWNPSCGCFVSAFFTAFNYVGYSGWSDPTACGGGGGQYGLGCPCVCKSDPFSLPIGCIPVSTSCCESIPFYESGNQLNIGTGTLSGTPNW